MDFAAGTSFGRYTIEALIGQGGMGRVYLARDTILERKVALKVVRPDREDEETTARFMREAKLAAQLAHPNTVHIYDLGEIGGVPFIAMEHVSGKTLFAYVGDRTTPTARKLRWLLDVARGLAAAHRCGMLHRDVKPTNVIVSEDGVAKILDFGLAKRIETTPEIRATFQTTLGFVVGTPAYMAPEQLEERGDVDARADQFAWAITAMMVLDGQNPRAVDPLLLSPVPQLYGRVAGVSKSASAVIQRAIAIDRTKRFPDMAALVTALDAALTEDLLRTSQPLATDLVPSVAEPSREPPTTQDAPVTPEVEIGPGPSPVASEAQTPAVAREIPKTFVTTDSGRIVAQHARTSVSAPFPHAPVQSPSAITPPPAAPIAIGGTVIVNATPVPPPPLAPPNATVAMMSPLAPAAPRPSSRPPSAGPNVASTLPLGEENPFGRANALVAFESPDERRAQRWKFEQKVFACASAPLRAAVFSSDGRRLAGVGSQGLILHDGGAWYFAPKPAGIAASALQCAAFLPQHRLAIGGDGIFGFTERDASWSIRRDLLPKTTRLRGVAFSPKPAPHLYFVGETLSGGVVVRLVLDGSPPVVLRAEHPLTTVVAAPLAIACGPHGIAFIEDDRVVSIPHPACKDAFHAIVIKDERSAIVAGAERAVALRRVVEPSAPTVVPHEVPLGERTHLLAIDEHGDEWMVSKTGLIFRRIQEWAGIGVIDVDSDPPLALWVSAKRVRIVTTGGAIFEGRRE